MAHLLTWGELAPTLSGPDELTSLLDAGLPFALTTVGNFNAGDQMTDIALTPNGQLYGISFTSLYSINKTTGAATYIADVPGSGNNALTFLPDGNLIAADAVSLASTAVAAREFDIADAALATAYRIRDEKGLPSHTAMSLTRVATELAARRAAAARAAGDTVPAEGQAPMSTELSAATEPRGDDGMTPQSRLTGDIRRARAAASRRDWESVRQLSTNWLRPDSGFELPVHYRADLLLLLGEAELRLGRDSAPTTLRTAVDIMEKHYASGSRSLAWGRQLLAGKMVEQ